MSVFQCIPFFITNFLFNYDQLRSITKINFVTFSLERQNKRSYIYSVKQQKNNNSNEINYFAET